MGQSIKRHIGRILLDGGLLSKHPIDKALEEQNYTKELLGQVLTRKGVLKVEDIKVPLIIQEHLGTIDKAVKIVAGERQLLGELLVESGHITIEQLDQVIAEQQRCSEKIGEIFKRLGLLNEQQLNALLDFQRNQEVVLPSPLRLGELLVATGHLNREQLNNALQSQTPTNKKLGEIFIEAGYVTSGQIEYGLRLQKMLKKAVLAAILSLVVNSATIPVVDNAYAANGEPCTFSEQLKSSPMRERYIATIATDTSTLLAHNTFTDDEIQSDASDDLFSVGYFGKKSSSFDHEGTFDPYSTDCLTCHDGSAASDRSVNYKNNPESKHSYNGTKEHPIGMNYASYVAADPISYKPITAFNSKLIFVNGKVGCLTCHNPLNPEKGHLVMSDFRSALCLTCHNKGN